MNYRNAPIILLLLILTNIVIADMGKTFELDFNTKNNYLLPLQKSDRILFEFDNSNHTIILDEIQAKRLEMDLFLYLDEQEHKNPIYLFFDEKHSLKIDINRDGTNDLLIRTTEFNKEKNIAMIYFEKITETKHEKKENITNNSNEKRLHWTSRIALVVIPIILLIVMYGYRKKRSGTYW